MDARVKQSIESYDEIDKAPTGKKSPVILEDASSSARPIRYSHVPKDSSRSSKPQDPSSLKSSDLVQSDIASPVGNVEEMKTYRGPFSVSCSTTKDPALVMNDMVRSLDLYSVSFQRLGNYFIKCQKSSVKFEMELTKMENLEFVYIVRILRTSGDINKYRDVASRILGSMKL